MKTAICVYLILVIKIVFTTSSFNLKSVDILTTKHITSLDLLNFDAVKNGDKVEIFWNVKSEANYSFFTLERSRDGIDFEKVSVIDAANSNIDVINYVETDYKPLHSISYYRLKLTTLNNEKSYSHTVMVNYIYDKSNISVYPNLSKDDLKISLKKIENTEILVVLRDLDGNEYFSKVLLVLENSEIIGIDTENKLNPGLYIITATSSNLLYSQKLIVR